MKYSSVTIQMKDIKQSFLWYYILCCTRSLSFLSLWLNASTVTVEIKATEQFQVLSFKVVLYQKSEFL